MATINKVILIGNLGKDIEVKYMPNGNAVANMTLATTESWKDKATGELQEKTEWHHIVLYRRLAEIAGEYLKKGAKVYIEGRLQTRQWEDKDNNKRYTTEIVAKNMQMFGNKINKEIKTPLHLTKPIVATAPKLEGYLKKGMEAGTTFVDNDEFNDEIPF